MPQFLRQVTPNVMSTSQNGRHCSRDCHLLNPGFLIHWHITALPQRWKIDATALRDSRVSHPTWDMQPFACFGGPHGSVSGSGGRWLSLNVPRDEQQLQVIWLSSKGNTRIRDRSPPLGERWMHISWQMCCFTNCKVGFGRLDDILDA
jgi:hypothetical protein